MNLEDPRLAINSSMLGRGYGSFTVTLFSFRLSTHILCVPSFFFTSTIGAAQGLLDGLTMSWSRRV